MSRAVNPASAVRTASSSPRRLRDCGRAVAALRLGADLPHRGSTELDAPTCERRSKTSRATSGFKSSAGMTVRPDHPLGDILSIVASCLVHAPALAMFLYSDVDEVPVRSTDITAEDY